MLEQYLTKVQFPLVELAKDKALINKGLRNLAKQCLSLI